MIKIQNTMRFFCCNSCAEMVREDFPVYDIKVGLDENNQAMSIALCKKCMKKLREEIDKIL